MNTLVFDIETIPDVDPLRAAPPLSECQKRG